MPLACLLLTFTKGSKYSKIWFKDSYCCNVGFHRWWGLVCAGVKTILAEKLNFMVPIGSNHSSRVSSLAYILLNSFPEDSDNDEIWPQIGEKYVKLKLKHLHLVTYVSAFIHVTFQVLFLCFRNWLHLLAIAFAATIHVKQHLQLEMFPSLVSQGFIHITAMGENICFPLQVPSAHRHQH